MEKTENQILTDEGFDFKTKYLGRELGWSIKPPTLGTLDRISTYLLKIKIREEELQENPLGEYKHIIKDNATLCARVIAIAVLRKRWKIKLFSNILTNHLKWQLKPAQITQFYIQIITMADLGNFTNSIRLMSGMTTTKPNPVE